MKLFLLLIIVMSSPLKAEMVDIQCPAVFPWSQMTELWETKGKVLAAKLLMKGVVVAVKDIQKNGPKRLAQISCLFLGIPMPEGMKLVFQYEEIHRKLGRAP